MRASDSSNLNLPDLGAIAVTDEQAAAVRLRVAEHARDADDAAFLLDALGIGGDA